MSRIRANQIVDGAGTGAPNFAHGLTATTGTFSGKVSVGGTLTYEDVTSIDSVGIITAQAGIHVTAGLVGIGTATPSQLLEIRGVEPRICLNGTTDDNDKGIEFEHLGQRRGSIFHNAGDGNLTISSGDNGSGYFINFKTDNTERLRIDSSGRLLLGTTTEGEATADNFTIADSGHCGITLRSGDDDVGTIFFSDGTSGNAEYEGYVQYDHSGNFMKFATNHAERLRITSDGTILAGGQSSSYDGGFVNLELRKDSNTVGGSMTLVNDTASQAGATCEIDCYQNYRGAGKIVFGRENANNWQSSAGGAASFLAFHTNNAGTVAERLRITSAGLMTTPYQPHFTAVGHTGWVNLAPGDKVEFQDLSSNANLNNSNRSGGYNTTNSRFTAPVDGLYRFTVHMYFNATNSGNICSILPRVNGAQVNPGDVYFFFSVGGFSGDISANGSTCLYLSADDYVEVYKRDNNTGTNSYYSQHCWFQGQLVG